MNAGLSYCEADYLPFGVVMDIVACNQIYHGAKEKKTYNINDGSLLELVEQMGCIADG